MIFRVPALLVVFLALRTVHGATAQNESRCNKFRDAWLPLIWEDLAPFAHTKLTPSTFALSVPEQASAAVWYRLEGNRLYVRGQPVDVLRGQDWHHKESVMYAHVLQHLVSLSGPFPTIEFIVEPGDRPYDPPRPGERRRTALRHCKRDGDSEILVPIFHFYGNIQNGKDRFSKQFLGPAMEMVKKEHPWESRRGDQVYAFYTPYERHQASEKCTRSYRMGADGQPVEVRPHFTEWAANTSNPKLNIGKEMLPMTEWAEFKYTAHVDGITCSSKLQKVLALGNLVFKEESGYRPFFGRMLQPFVHYVPFWVERPQELLDALAWAEANDDAAEKIARRGQDFVARYLTPLGLNCYWDLLLRELPMIMDVGAWKGVRSAEEQRRTGGTGPEVASGIPESYVPLVPVEEWLATVERDFDRVWRPKGDLDLE